jgi:hypothetical protein
MKHTMTAKERMVLDVLQETMLKAELTQQEMHTVSVVLLANLILGINRDKAIAEGGLLDETVKSLRSAMEMLRRVKAEEDKIKGNVA